MKRFVWIWLICALLLAFSCCGKDEEEAPVTESQTESETETETEAKETLPETEDPFEYEGGDIEQDFSDIFN